MPRLELIFCIVLFVLVMFGIKFLLVPWRLVGYGWAGIAGLIGATFLYRFLVEAQKRKLNR